MSPGFATYLALLWACSGDRYLSEPVPPDGSTAIRLTTDRLSYARGAPAKLELLNESADTVLFGGCHDVLERLLPTGEWVGLRPLGHSCPDIALLLLPGIPWTLPFDLRPATVAGAYRLRRPFSPFRAGVEGTFYRRSNVFQITP